ncbi:MAG: aspartate/glutamate racemase family protein [Pseudomonadota bacterium]
MHLGLIGGIGPAATDLYYRGLVSALAARGRPLEMTVAHADAPTLIANMTAGDQATQAALFRDRIARLERAGAESAAVTSIAGHFCIDALKPLSPLPLIDLLDAVAAALKDRGLARVGVLGTMGAMSSGLYGRLSPVETLAPAGDDLGAVHAAYVAMATAAAVTDAQRDAFFAAGRRLVADQGAEAVLLGGTDLFLAFDGHDPGFPIVDCARIHIAALARAAAGDAP